MEAERACALAEQWPADLKGKLGEVEMRLTQAKSVILAWDKEVAALKEAVAESNDKFYDMGFADVKNSSEPIMVESRWLLWIPWAFLRIPLSGNQNKYPTLRSFSAPHPDHCSGWRRR